MANTLFRIACNTVATLHGQLTCPDDASFNAGTYDKVYGQLKGFYSLANQRYGRLCKGRFLLREFTKSCTVVGANKFLLDTTTSPERLEEKSFRNATAGYGQPLLFYPGGYRQWTQDYPEGESTTGQPTYWFIYPPDGSGAEYFGLSCPVNQTFSVKYSGWLRATPLVNATDPIIWAPDFEDGITLAAGTFLEFCLAEGKMPDIQQFLDPVFSEIEQNSMGPYEDKHGVDLGIEIWPW